MATPSRSGCGCSSSSIRPGGARRRPCGETGPGTPLSDAPAGSDVRGGPLRAMIGGVAGKEQGMNRRTWVNAGCTVLGALSVMVLTTGVAAAGQDAKRGEAVYADQKCSLCHSIAGKGNAKGSLDDVGSKLSAAEIKEWIVNPKEMTAKSKSERKPPMKAYPSLPAADVDALVAYLQTLKK